MHLGVVYGVFRRCQAVLGGITGVFREFCARNGSGEAEKWTSVSPRYKVEAAHYDVAGR